MKGNLKGGMKGGRSGKKRDRRAAMGQRRWSSSSSFSHDKLKIPVNRFWLGRCSRHELGKVARGGKEKTLNQNNYLLQQKDKSWREFLSRVVTYLPHSRMLLVRLADNLADFSKCCVCADGVQVCSVFKASVWSNRDKTLYAWDCKVFCSAVW